MARIASTTTAGTPVDPTGGMTLDALMARQKALAQQGQQIAAPRDMPSPWQGAAQMAQAFVNARQGSAAQEQETAGRDAMAKIMAGINMETGATSDQLAQLGRLNPDEADKMMQLAAQAIQSRRALEAANANREDQQGFTHTENELNRQTEMDKATAAAKLQMMPKISDISGVRQDVISDPSYKNMAQAVPIWTSMKDAATRDTPQADLNMVVGLAKLLDPTSVVRQSETGAVELTGNLPSQLTAQYKFLTADPGARLPLNVRQGLLDEAYSRVKGYSDAYAKTSDWFTNMSKESGIDPTKVVPTFAEAGPMDNNLIAPRPAPGPATPGALGGGAGATPVPSIGAGDVDAYRALPPGAQYTEPGKMDPNGGLMIFIKPAAPAAPPVRQAVPNGGP